MIRYFHRTRDSDHLFLGFQILGQATFLFLFFLLLLIFYRQLFSAVPRPREIKVVYKYFNSMTQCLLIDTEPNLACDCIIYLYLKVPGNFVRLIF